ncbi:Autophagy protein 7 [Scheffersomyces spartinae]|uniref:Ubiquitin-like modifier-activating enzyme ATG7 n=1 Tax=Scheffersomyces spartinae TaxID=45513 RepID=A0A9P8AHP4_9ASCO|nr:Autophagy protein 7 [Scheffersomyces spartinae]KAG7192987.1 Autophagy protein 7 [Scheffersomyces spartinae]
MKLGTSARSIWGFITSPHKLTRFDDKPIVNVDKLSFEQNEEDPTGNFVLDAELLNVNTIEEFKEINKAELLKKWGHIILRHIETGCITEQLLNKVFLLTFSDLKKYKFYYWFAFPTLESNWRVLHRGPAESLAITNVASTSSLLSQVDEDGHIVLFKDILLEKGNKFVFQDTVLDPDMKPSVHLKNYLYYLAYIGFTEIELVIYRSNNTSELLNLELSSPVNKISPKILGWERTAQGRLGPKVAELGLLINPNQLAEQAVDLNLRLMKWRIAPELDLDIIKLQKVLLLGAGTLGSYVSRILMGWGVREITFVDNGRVSYSNPVRQPLFNFADCFSSSGKGEYKAIQAARALHEIFPGAIAEGIVLDVPMVGHPISEATEGKLKSEYEKLMQLISSHDVVFLLMDSRESRWLPTVAGLSKDKIVINAALGFDSYLVMRHGSLKQAPESRLGCYYCNDVVAPSDSLSDRTLDQMCTVTRAGCAPLASALAVELFISLLQHPENEAALADETNPKFGEVPHQIRGSLHNFQLTKLHAPAFKNCSACSTNVVEHFEKDGWEFVKKCLNDSKYLEDISELTQVHAEAEKAAAQLLEDLLLDNDDEDSEWIS